MEKPLFWYQGLFLQPQHLQMKDQYDFSTFEPYQKYSHPHLWGVGEIAIETDAIENGSFHIKNGKFWFPDSTYVEVPGNGVIETRSMEHIWDRGESVIVYLGLRKFSKFESNVTENSDVRLDERFIAEKEHNEVSDLHKGDGAPARIKMLNHNLKIFFGPEAEGAGHYSLIPIAKIIKRSNQYSLNEDYIPPCFSMKGSYRYETSMKEIIDSLNAKTIELGRFKKQRGINAAEFGSKDMVYLLSLQTLNRYLPLLVHMKEASAHPWDVYGLLKQLAGELSAFSDEDIHLGDSDMKQSPVKPYDHKKLWDCFSSIMDMINKFTGEITSGPEYTISMKRDDVYFNGLLNSSHVEGVKNYYLVIKTAEDQNIVKESLEEFSKLSSKEDIPVLVSQSLPGIEMEFLENLPKQLPRRSNCLYYKLNSHSDFFTNVKKELAISMFWDSVPEDVTIDLMITGS